MATTDDVPNAPTTTMAAPENKRRTGGGGSKGIDIHKALDILSMRDNGGGASQGDDCGCHNSRTAPRGAEKLGQQINLLTARAAIEEEESKSGEAKIDEKQRQVDRKKEIQATLATLSIKELLEAVMEAQKERVAVYRAYDEGLATVLSTRNITDYPAMVAAATASFSVLSETLGSIRALLLGERAALAKHVAQLQKYEQTKLQLTAALHLEQIRVSSSAEGSVKNLLQKGVFSLKKQVVECVEQINDVLDELRSAMLDEQEEEE